MTAADDDCGARSFIENMLRFGMYPDVFQKSEAEAKEELMNITSNYLYKDILTYGNLKRPDIIYELFTILTHRKHEAKNQK